MQSIILQLLLSAFLSAWVGVELDYECVEEEFESCCSMWGGLYSEDLHGHQICDTGGDPELDEDFMNCMYRRCASPSINESLFAPRYDDRHFRTIEREQTLF